jgi:hypothetical protein
MISMIRSGLRKNCGDKRVKESGARVSLDNRVGPPDLCGAGAEVYWEFRVT